ncbi:MAG TPA: alpha/beta hydrolase [Lutibacter sp.]|nr:alpha/beta hydrolase [Lutibacter sp.]
MIYLLLFVLLILVLGLYNYSTPKRDFFKLYPHDDTFSQSLKEFQTQKTTEIEINNVKWTYYSGGQGAKTILFLHGMGGSYDLWWQQIQELEKDHKVISYSLPESIYNLEDTSNGIQAILEKEKVGTFIAIGTSMGGYISQYLVSTMPERIEKVVFGNTFPPNDIIINANKGKAKVIPYLPELVLLKLSDKKLHKELIPAANNSELLKAFLPSIPFSKKQFMNRYAVVIDRFEIDPSKPMLKSIPKLIIESNNDPLVQKELRTALIKLYPEAETYTFNKAGHFPYINEAKLYNEVLNSFLNNNNN